MYALREQPAEDGPVGEVEREQVERRRLLLEARPKNRGTEEEDRDHGHAFALLAAQLREQQHVAEEREREGNHCRAERLRECRDVDRNDAEEQQQCNGDEHGGPDRDEPPATPPFFHARVVHRDACVAKVMLRELVLQ